MNKKMITFIAIIIVILGSGFAMKSIFTGKEIKKNNEINIIHKEEQDRLKNYILKNIILTKNEKIKKITFIQFEKDDIAGNWLITVKINNKYLMSLSEDKLGGQIRTSGYSSNELKEKKLSSSEINNENIEVDYFEGEYIRF
ncbi:hypothetical protein DIX61_01295 [Streptococcus iniae]|uniref:Uncharacterized protein n=3 Tax=Streptococcus iniae TaxID=1346 RepID=A0A3L8GQ61_STRIN|nr:hypothetical protein [Streptococcus iniae]AGM98157.1 hypothetical protein K710_0355 [Streptococcus iniae SF1]AJG25403.1 hypothetical protein SI82_01975 [Streptococcus iniae]APD31274.1 hypothetical protein BMF34_01870 [Streptococcus iniae]ASL34197.1 membrane protein [Streptococcus iniae]ATX39145.1 hypothetical protein CTW00_00945 [Streptococcus iniae]